MGLLGRYSVTLDNKNRLIVPAKFRYTLGEAKIVLSLGKDPQCLFLSNEQQLTSLSNSFLTGPDNAFNRKLQRHYYAYCTSCEMDEIGRITIPEQLLTLLGLSTQNREIVFIGMNNYCEVWAANILQPQIQDFDQTKFVEQIETKTAKIQAATFYGDQLVKQANNV